MPEFGSEHSTPPRVIAAETGVTGRHARDSDCAGGGNRTRTALRPRNFKSRASASSATPARAYSTRSFAAPTRPGYRADTLIDEMQSLNTGLHGPVTTSRSATSATYVADAPEKLRSR